MNWLKSRDVTDPVELTIEKPGDVTPSRQGELVPYESRQSTGISNEIDRGKLQVIETEADALADKALVSERDFGHQLNAVLTTKGVSANELATQVYDTAEAIRQAAEKKGLSVPVQAGNIRMDNPVDYLTSIATDAEALTGHIARQRPSYGYDICVNASDLEVLVRELRQLLSSFTTQLAALGHTPHTNYCRQACCPRTCLYNRLREQDERMNAYWTCLSVF